MSPARGWDTVKTLLLLRREPCDWQRYRSMRRPTGATTRGFATAPFGRSTTTLSAHPGSSRTSSTHLSKSTVRSPTGLRTSHPWAPACGSMITTFSSCHGCFASNAPTSALASSFIRPSRPRKSFRDCLGASRSLTASLGRTSSASRHPGMHAASLMPARVSPAERSSAAPFASGNARPQSVRSPLA